LFGTEIEAIRSREQRQLKDSPLHDGLSPRDTAAVAASLGAAVPLKSTASHGA
jgi:hypothetical protein